MSSNASDHGLRALPAGAPGPLYRQVRRELQHVMESGRYVPGDTLPNESVMSQALGVSIGTLRRAVDELVHEHVLVRQQGRGTFVALHSDDRFLFQFFHVEPRQVAATGQPPLGREYPHVECVAFARGKAEEAEASALNIRPGEPVVRIDNRLSLAGRPVVHDRLILPGLTFRGLTEQRFIQRPGTVYSLYQSDHGITVLRARERARATAASRDTARILGVAIGLPVLEVHRVALTFGERAVEYRISTIDTTGHDYVSLLSKP